MAKKRRAFGLDNLTNPWARLRRRAALREQRAAIELVELEARLLFSAAPVPDLWTADLADPGAVSLEWQDAFPAAPSVNSAIEILGADLLNHAPGNWLDDAWSADPALPDSAAEGQQVAFVDSSAEGLEVLLQSMRDSGIANLEVVLLDASTDGVTQISQWLSGRTGVSAVHVISHGADGFLQLGSARLGIHSLRGYAGEIAGWSLAFTDDADLLFYGCDLAGSAEGRELIESIAALTQADVAASDDLTGHADLGGDWDLEFRYGAVSTDVVVGARWQPEWYGTLSTATLTFQEGTAGYSGTQDTYIRQGAATTNYGTATTANVDSDDGSGVAQALIRFDNLFGYNAGQIPYGAQIVSASLTVQTTGTTAGTISLYRILVNWDESTATWTTLSNGLSADGIEMSAVADSSLTNLPAGATTFTGLAATLQAWSDRSGSYGWGLLSNSIDGWYFDTSEGAIRPSLSVTYITPGTQASTAHTLTVDTAADILDGDTSSIDALLSNMGADGKISLREAIRAANNTQNNGSTPDQINFAIGSGAQTIMVASGGLPDILDPVNIDARTQPGYSSTPLITLNGTNASGATAGLNLLTSNSTISGFIVRNFGDDGLEIGGQSGYGDNNILQYNWIGIDASGNPAPVSDIGILITDNADNNIVRFNVVASSGSHGIVVRNTDSHGNWIYGNTIGLAADGVTIRANGGHGIYIHDAGAANVIGSNIDGTSDAAERNTISGNALDGIYIENAAGTLIRGNYIGTNAAGTAARGNGDEGISIQNAAGTVVGGNVAAARNIISGNNGAGILIQTAASSTIVQGNYIGTDVTGAVDLGNGKINPAGDQGGIRVWNAGAGNRIGGLNAGDANLIAFNTAAGIEVGGTSTGVQVQRNRIHSNTGLGIDLNGDGVTANDAGDGDSGPNALQNFPVLTSATLISTTQVAIAGSLNSTANSWFRIEFFASAAPGDPSSHGEADRFLGFVNVATNGAGNATFNVSLNAAVAIGERVTATATASDATYTTFQSSSEFAQNATATNSAPAITNGYTHNLAGTNEDTTSSGTLASAILSGASWSDADSGALSGLAITGQTGNGTWQYSTDGVSWTAFGAVNATNALLITSTTQVRYIPNSANGETATFAWKAWDQTSGTASVNGTPSYANPGAGGGTTAYSANNASAQIVVSSVNDAPVVDNSGTMTLTTVNEDATGNSGQSVASIIASAGGDRITDVDTGAVEGIAITALTSGNGTWEYSTNGGGSWTAVGTVSNASALLLRAADLVRFVPDGQNGTSASFDFRAWDQTSGSFGTKVDVSTNGGTSAFSSATETAAITVTSVNDAPVMDPNGTMTLTTITEDDINNSGNLVSAIIASAGGDRITDVDSGALEGIAIFDLVSSNGTWQFNTGSGWNNVGPVSLTSSLLLRATDSLRFVPGGQTSDTTFVTFAAWDQTTGTAGTKVDSSVYGGTTAFSDQVETAAIIVTGVNDAPVLDNSGTMTLTTINEDQTANGGNTIASIIASAGGDRITDVDGGAEGIAIYSLASGNGTWQYSTNGGGSWTNVGAVAANSALLLRDTDLVRLVPNGQNGTSASFDFRAWDQSSGTAGNKVDVSTNGGTTAFSTATETASITVTSVNDAPTIINGYTHNLAGTNEDTTSSGTLASAILAGASWADVDTGALSGMAITSRTGNGIWQYSTDGVTWTNFGAVSATNALLITSTTQVRYIPDGANGETATFTWKAWDRTTGTASTNGTPGYANPGAGGGTTAYSANSASAQITVTDVNDAPTPADDTFGLEFDGTDDYVGIASSASLTMSATVTLEAWINPDASANVNRMIINKEGEFEVALFADNTIRWAFANTNPGWNWHNTGATVTNGTWTHIAVSYDNGTVTTYVNGVVVDVYNGSGVIGDAHVTLNELRIGGRSNSPGGKYFDGRIDDVRVWNTARTQAEIVANLDAALTGGEAGLVALWSFNEGTGSIANDATGFANHGTLFDGGAGTAGPQWIGYATGQNSILNVNATSGILANDFDLDGDGLSVIEVNGSAANVGSPIVLASGASLTVNAGGDFTYDPNGAFDYLAAGARTSDSFTYTIDDGNGSTDTATVYITITGDNDAPVLDNSGTMSLTSINEDQTSISGDTVASIIASAGGDRIIDVDSGAVEGIAVTTLASGNGTWQYSINGGGSWLAIGAVSDSSALLLRSSDLVRFVPNGQSGTVASFDFRAWDQTSGSAGTKVDVSVNGGITAFSTAVETAAIVVTDVNDEEVLATNTGMTVLEGSTGNVITAAMLQTTDVDHTPSQLVYTVTSVPVNGIIRRSGINLSVSSTFTQADIDAGLITYLHNDTETSSDSFAFTVDDGAGSVSGGTFNITINLVNDNSVSAINDSDGAIDFVLENSSNGTVVGITAFADDPDSGDTVSYSLDNDAGGRFAIDSNTGVVTVNGAIDREAAGTWNITVRATSTDTSTVTRVFAIAIGDVDEFNVGPVTDVDGTTNSVAENATVGTAVGITASASDADATNNTITYTLTDDDGGRFQIDANSGVVTVAGAIDRETDGPLRNITVRASSSDGSFTDQGFVINIIDVNEAPTGIAPVSFTVNENIDTTGGFAVGTLSANDADAGDSFSWSVVGGPDASLFSFGGAGGNELLLDDGLLDFESQATYSVIVRVTDSGGLTFDQSVTVDINNLNEAPTAVAPVSFSISENTDTTGGYLLGTLSAADPDSGESFSWSIVGGPDAARFSFGGAGGNELMIDAGVLDFEAQQVYSAVVRVTDSGGLIFDQTVTVNVSDVNDLPVLANNGSTAVEGGTDLIDNSELAASDADNGPSELVFSVTIGPANGRLERVGQPGVSVVTFTQAEVDAGLIRYIHDGGETTTDQFRFDLSDGQGGTLLNQTFNLTITPVNDVPQAAADFFSATEDQTYSGSSVLANDTDADGDALTAVLVSGPSRAASFVLNADGTFTYTPDANFYGTDQFQYRASDGSAFSQIVTVSIQVAPVNDAPLGQTDQATALAGQVLIALASVLANDSDVENDALEAILVSGPGNGTVLLNRDGTFTYIPAAGFTGVDSFTYLPNDGSANGTLTVVQINVVAPGPVDPGSNPVDDPPSGTDGDTSPPNSDNGGTEQEPENKEKTPPVAATSPAALLLTSPDGADDHPARSTLEDLEASELALSADMVRSVIPESTTALDVLELLLAEYREQRQSGDRAEGIGTVGGMSFVFNARYLWQQMDRLADDVLGSSDFRFVLTTSIAVSTITATAGYLIWTLRGGFLIATLVSSLPVWSHFDPLPVLESNEKRRTGRQDEKVEGIFD